MIPTMSFPNWDYPLNDVQKIMLLFGRRTPRICVGILPFYTLKELKKAVSYLSDFVYHSGGYIQTAQWFVEHSYLDYGYYLLNVKYQRR